MSIMLLCVCVCLVYLFSDKKIENMQYEKEQF